jgi:hypothetical protein
LQQAILDCEESMIKIDTKKQPRSLLIEEERNRNLLLL